MHKLIRHIIGVFQALIQQGFQKHLAGILLWGLILLCSASLSGQYKFNQSIVYDEEDGLPSNSIAAIQKGHDGFLWITTSKGLCRFDGGQFKIFQHDPEDAYSIMDNRTLPLLALANEIWVGSALGVSVMDLKTERFRNYQLNEKGKTDSLKFERASEINALFEDNQGEIWIGSRYAGLFKYDRIQDDFIPYRYKGQLDTALFSHVEGVHDIRSFAQAPENDSIVWAGTSNGLMEINKRTGTVELHTFPNESPSNRPEFNLFIPNALSSGLDIYWLLSTQYPCI